MAVVTSLDFQMNLASTGVGSVPPTIEASQSDVYLNSPVAPNHFIVFDMLQKGICYPFTTKDGDINLVYNEFMQLMYEPGADIQALADEMAEVVNDILQS